LVLMALFCLDFMLALFSCHFYGDIAPEYFGNPLIAAYSIFQMFTIEGWNEISAVIGQHMADNGSGDIIIGFTKFFFVMIVLIGGIFGMSLANAIFVDEMTVDNNLELEKKIDVLQTQIEELKELIVNK
jgi:voltage-gated sodium channel